MVPPPHLALRASGIDTHRFHRGQVDHETVVAQRAAGVVVAATTDRHLETLLSSEVQGDSDVIAAGTTRNDGWASGDRCVPDVDGIGG